MLTKFNLRLIQDLAYNDIERPSNTTIPESTQSNEHVNIIHTSILQNLSDEIDHDRNISSKWNLYLEKFQEEVQSTQDLTERIHSDCLLAVDIIKNWRKIDEQLDSLNAKCKELEEQFRFVSCKIWTMLGYHGDKGIPIQEAINVVQVIRLLGKTVEENIAEHYQIRVAHHKELHSLKVHQQKLVVLFFLMRNTLSVIVEEANIDDKVSEYISQFDKHYARETKMQQLPEYLSL